MYKLDLASVQKLLWSLDNRRYEGTYDNEGKMIFRDVFCNERISYKNLMQNLSYYSIKLYYFTKLEEKNIKKAFNELKLTPSNLIERNNEFMTNKKEDIEKKYNAMTLDELEDINFVYEMQDFIYVGKSIDEIDEYRIFKKILKNKRG